MTVFDIIGPIMIGPSSSHTAGAVRIGRTARKILNDKPVSARILLSGSFAQTYRGHGTDKALIAGSMGFHSHDERIPKALEIAKEEGIEYSFEITDIPDSHPNTACVELKGENGTTCIIRGSSIGGGNIVITEINGQAVFFTGQYNTLLVIHQDRPGTIAAVTEYMARSNINIGNFRLSRLMRGGEAVMTIEIDGGVDDEIINNLRKVKNVTKVILIRAI